ncbi:hypothetical protein ADL26_17885, partial [Thermoactinomyces vulgaris]
PRSDPEHTGYRAADIAARGAAALAAAASFPTADADSMSPVALAFPANVTSAPASRGYSRPAAPPSHDRARGISR